MFIERDIQKDIEKWINEKEIIAIRGARQTGKTTILLKIKDKLIESRISERNIYYLTFEDDNLRLRFEKDPLEFVSYYINLSKDKTYFLIDEIQYVKDVGKKLKLIYDTYDNIKIIITGSSSFDLTNLGKFLVGRVIFFDNHPFNFREFLKTKDEKLLSLYDKNKLYLFNPDIKPEILFIDELNKCLHEFLTYGGYPRVVLEKDISKKKEILRNLFTTYIEKDVVGLYGNKYRDNVVKLLKTLSVIMGNVVNYETLSEHSSLKYNDVLKILPILQDSFIINIAKPFHKNKLNELRKNPKIYFVDYGFRNYIIENFDNLEFDYLYENFVFNQVKFDHNNKTLKYWRTTNKTEVDFVIDDHNIIPIEVKTTAKVTRSLMSFLLTYKPKYAIITDLKEYKKLSVKKCDVFIVPLISF